jgi:large subunit ribosomal protein L19
MEIIKKIEQEQLRIDIPQFKAGDTVKVHQRIIEGVVLRVHRGTTNATFTVRKVSDGVGVERIYPLHSPFIERVELISEGRVRRSRIYYLRNLKGKAARIKTKNQWD